MSKAIGAFFFVIGILILFVLAFDLFLVVPFFIFIIGLIAMFVSDRKQSPERKESQERARQQEREEPV